MTQFPHFKKFTLMEQSESTASDSTKELSSEQIYHKYLSESMVGSQNYIRSIAAMKEYASQKDAQIQALTKEVEELRGLQAEGVMIYIKLKEAGNKMAEALRPLCTDIKITNNRTLDYVKNGKQSLSEWFECIVLNGA